MTDEQSKRPTFSDDVPPASAVQPDPGTTDRGDYLGQPRELADIDAERLKDASTAAARILFGPAVKRMTVITKSVVDQTLSGDFAVFLPLATMVSAMAELQWEHAPRGAQARLFLLTSRSLIRMGEKFRRAVSDIREGLPVGVPPWGASDTSIVYNETEAELPMGPPVHTPPDVIVAMLSETPLGGTLSAERLLALVSTWSEAELDAAEAYLLNFIARMNGEDIDAMTTPAHIAALTEVAARG